MTGLCIVRNDRAGVAVFQSMKDVIGTCRPMPLTSIQVNVTKDLRLNPFGQIDTAAATWFYLQLFCVLKGLQDVPLH
jgi:hypothetical protein